MNWCEDNIHDIQMSLSNASKLCDKQCFTKPDKEVSKKILVYLEEAKEELENFINSVRTAEQERKVL